MENQISCTYCLNEVEIIIKGIKYCPKCFTNFFGKKVGKSLSVFPKTCSILVVSVDNIASRCVISAIGSFNMRSKSLRYLKVSKYGIQQDSGVLTDSDTSIDHENLIPKQEFDYIERYKAEIIAEAKKLDCFGVVIGVGTEDIVYSSISKLLNGLGRECASLAGTEVINGISIINCLSRISREEIATFARLNGIRKSEMPSARKNSITEEFMEDVFNRNSGVFNNFVELLKKVDIPSFCMVCKKYSCGTCNL